MITWTSWEFQYSLYRFCCADRTGKRRHYPIRRGLTYPELRALVARTHEILRRNGLHTHDTVAVALRNGRETAALSLALLTYCRIAPLNPGYTQSEISFALQDLRAAEESGLRRMVMSPAGGPAFGVFELTGESAGTDAGGGAAPSPDDIAPLLHTSGTTARPKLVPLTQRNLTLSARSGRQSSCAKVGVTQRTRSGTAQVGTEWMNRSR